jgi:hypothetical protein
MNQARSFRNRLNNARLVVGEHERNQHAASERSEPVLERRQVELPVAGDRHLLNGRRRKTPPREHGRVLDG